jgi:hypothetical protein
MPLIIGWLIIIRGGIEILAKIKKGKRMILGEYGSRLIY